ncbi:beta-galactosidase [Roseobacter sp.]|uniref:beta-galactosidase n=1 Tax=Roseobacter sp. TaxID=1907202 RepID=UPI003299FBFA
MKRTLGVCYYPEHWPEDMWPHDAAEMVDAGISWVRIGEFAWSRLEPTPGTYQFDWLDRAIDVLSRAGLKIILGTPTCTPPRWMLTQFPDMLAVNAQGQPRKFGSRRHYCFSHAGYRAASAEIAAVLGDRYGHDPRINGWQIDNEYGCHDTAISYSDAARDAFRVWLAGQYGDIDALNTAWGNVFWSMEYACFDDIDLPNLTVTEPNPSHDMAFRRFTSDQVVAYHTAQVAALRARTGMPLIHNYMGRVLDFDHFEVGASIDIASWDSYPIGFLSDRLEGSAAHKTRYLQQGDPDMQAFHHDLYRAVGRDNRWWVMEQQPGPVNWAPHNPAPLPGMVRLWSWEAFAHGAEVVSYFRWRQAPFAQEQMHAGLKRPDNADAVGLLEAAQVGREIAEMPDIALQKAAVALVFDYPSAWAWDVLPQGAGFSYFRLMLDAYRALRRAGFSIDIVPSTATDLSDYALVLAPGLATTPQTLCAAMANTVALVGPRSNAVTHDLTIPTPMGPDLRGLDVVVARVESLPPDVRRPVRGGGAVQHWMEDLQGTAPTVFETETGQPVVKGADDLHYLGAWPDATLWDRIIAGLAQRAGLTPQSLPQGVRLRDTATHRFAFNYGPEPVCFDGKSLAPAGVAWWAI